MIYIERVHNSANEWRINLPPNLCREIGLQRKAQFLVFAVDPETIVLHQITPDKIIDFPHMVQKVGRVLYEPETNN